METKSHSVGGVSTGPPAFAVEVTANSKVGPVAATYAAQQSCPDCRFKGGNGCYAEWGPLGIITRRLNAAGCDDPLAVAECEADAIDSLSATRDLRLHVVGDCRTAAAARVVSAAVRRYLRRASQVRRRQLRLVRAWAYTHAWTRVPRSAWKGVSVLASCETAEQARQAHDRGYAAVVVVPRFDAKSAYPLGNTGLKVVPCPEQTRGTQCVDCRLCMDADRLHAAGLVIGFTPNGSKHTRRLALETITIGQATAD